MQPPYTLPLHVQSIHRTGPKFDLYVPRVVNMSNKAAQDRINDTINRQVHAMLSESGYLQNPKTTEISGFYEIKTNERGLFSITLELYAYPEHAAHGTTWIRGLTFDTASGKSYRLGELFKPGSDYVKRISTIVAAQIKERGIETLEPFTGISPNQDYYVADKALVVYFQLYELTPYVFGFPMFPISVYSLQDIIAESSPLQPFAING